MSRKILTLSLAVGLTSAAPGPVQGKVPSDPVAKTTTPIESEGVVSSVEPREPSTRVPPKMRFIPGGETEVGLDEKEIQALDLESPAEIKTFAASTPKHKVDVAPFFLDIFETNNAQWKLYLELTEQEPGEDLVKEYWIDGEIPAGHENYPIIWVSFPEVVAYCRWANRRLPTEYEWELAARGAEALPFPWGVHFDDPDPKAGKRKKPKTVEEAEALEKELAALTQGEDRAHCAGGRSTTAQEVGTRPDGVSGYGIHDLAGNVWEWTASPYLPYPGNEEIKISSTYTRGKRAKYTAAEFFNSNQRVIRGGCFLNEEHGLISALRQFAVMGMWDPTVGFRCAKSVTPGLDAAQTALDRLGNYRFHDTPINLDAVLAVERSLYSQEGLIAGYQGIVFAPVSEWERLKKIEKESKLEPVPLGLFSATADCVVPTLPAGTYMITFQAADPKFKPLKEADFPERGWVYHGWEERDTRVKKPAKKPRKSRSKSKSKEAEKKEGDEEKPEKELTEEEKELEKYRYVAYEGSVEYDRKRSNILIVNEQNVVMAAFPLDKVKEASKGVDHSLAIKRVGKDDRKKIGPTELYSFSFSVPLPARKFVNFEIPLRYEPDIFDVAAINNSPRVSEKSAADER